MSALADLPLLAKGKVREMYDLGAPDGDRLLMVASDRISTYDAVHPTPIPDKGRVLTGLSVFWFGLTEQIVANHLISASDGVPEEARGRALVVRKLEMFPVECVVRGYITGSGWKDYQATGVVSGIVLPDGLRESQQLPEPIFTPSTKADVGHDEAIDFDRAAELVGDRALMERVRDVSIELYSFAAAHARERGVILADTKFELGLDPAGELIVGDGADARLLPLLAGRHVRGRPLPAELRQAVRARLGLPKWVGQASSRPGDPRGRSRGHARALRRGVRADRRRALPGVAGAQRGAGLIRRPTRGLQPMAVGSR